MERRPETTHGPERKNRAPRTQAEQRVARKLLRLARQAQHVPRRANGDQILAALRDWWRETRGVW